MDRKMNPVTVFTFREHQQFREEEKSILQSLEITLQGKPENGEPPKYLGIDENSASYYIGASWLTADHAVAVLPKRIDSGDDKIATDFIAMYLEVLQCAPAAEYFSKCYDIDFTQPPIECGVLNEQLTPLLIFHFIFYVQIILKKGLKKHYVIREENLQSKVRGRILMQKNLEKNIFTKRLDRTFCKFQEYTVDIPENRLLKKALLFSARYFNTYSGLSSHESFKTIKIKMQEMISAFHLVSDTIEIYEIKNLKRNKMFKEYSEAIRLAKMILQRFDFSIANAQLCKRTVPPFWIDMSRLYEVYVYTQLEKAYPGQIGFQVSGYQSTALDFIHKSAGVILDTKYKTRYQNSNKDMLDDIRQLSGHARDEKILANFEPAIRDTVRPCVIIYPVIQSGETVASFSNDICDVLNDEHKISGFKNFYKISVELPKKTHT